MKWVYNNQYHQYKQTEADLLWLARAVAREGKPYDAVAWTLLQRFALLYPMYPTLAEFGLQPTSEPEMVSRRRQAPGRHEGSQR
jgi:hypothetical protein